MPQFPSPTNAANQPLDESACNYLIIIIKKIQTCGPRTCMTGRGGENNGAKREKLSKFVGFLETTKSARTLRNPRKYATIGEKKPTG